MAKIPVDATAFSAFDMQELSAESFDASLAEAGDELAVVFFWGLDCFNCEIAEKGHARSDRTRSVRSACGGFTAMSTSTAILAGVSCFMVCRRGSFFHRGKRLGRATGWHGLAPVRSGGCRGARENPLGQSGRWCASRRSGFGQKSGRLKKIKDRIAKEVLKTMRTHLCCVQV